MVIHLVDWAVTPVPFAVRPRTDRFGATPWTVALRRSTAYRPEVHRRAQERGDLAELAGETPRETTGYGPYTAVSVPALHPWGLPFVRPASP